MTNQDQYEIMCDVYDKYKNGKLVEVVRCKECKWYVSYTMENKTYKMCKKAHLGSDDFFCADGQKMDGDSTQNNDSNVLGALDGEVKSDESN